MKNNRSFIIMFGFLAMAAAISVYLVVGRSRETAPARQALARFPERVGGWRAIDAQTLGDAQASELNADDYLSRTYANDRGVIAFFFTAWYAGQGHRRTMHSPQNCMPGAGWSMGSYRQHSIAVQPSTKSEINEYLIEKDGVRMLAFYWYQGRGRITSGDYSSRVLLLYDGLVVGRTDGALVRVIVPISDVSGGELRARTAGLNFAGTMIPVLRQFIP